MLPCPLCLGLKKHAHNCPDAPDVSPESDKTYDDIEDFLDLGESGG